MPDPSAYENEKEWMAACVPKRIEEGDEQDQAVAVCMGMWRDKDKKNAETLVYFGNPVKALGDGKVGGYLVRFSTAEDPDISPERDFFTKDTDYMMLFPGHSPAWFNHSLDDKKKRLSHDADLVEDEFGIWAETILDERDQYEKFLLSLAKSGKLGWSSGTAAHLVEREAVGAAHHVKRWPLGLDASLTHIPAEPRNSVIPLKSLSAIPLPDQLPEDEPEVDASTASEGVEKGETKSLDAISKEVAMEENKETPQVIQMTKEELAGLMEQSAQKALRELPAKQEAKAIPKVEVVVDESEQPFKSAGEFFKAVAIAGMGHGEDVRLRSLQSEDGYAVRAYKASPTGLGEEMPSRGGFLVDQPTQPGLLERMYQDGEVLNRVNWIDVGPNANGIVLNAVDETSRVDGSRWGGVRGYWVAEAGTITASYPQFRPMNLRLNKVAALCYATDELVSDAAALESWLMRVVPAELRFKVEDAFINGNGAGKPKGVLNDATIYVAISAETGQAGTTLIYENVLKMWAQCWAPSRRNAVWYVNQDVEPQLNSMSLAVGTAGVPVYLPAGGASGQPFGTLFGRPVVPIEYCATMGTVGDIILADMSQYQAIRKGGVQSASSIHVNFASDEMVYRFIYRVDGQPMWNAYLTPFKGSAYKSPFLAVATRS